MRQADHGALKRGVPANGLIGNSLASMSFDQEFRAKPGQEKIMRRRFARMIAGLAAATVLAISPANAQQSVPQTTTIAPLVDHHVHLGSAALSDQVDEMQKLDPSAFEHLSKDIFSRPTPADAIHILDEAGVKRAVLISTAYFFMLTPDPAEAARKMREENRFIVDTALSSNGRLIAFIAVNPLAANAREELKYWAGKPGVSGIKLHLGAAGFKASSPEQVAKLATFFTAAQEAHLPLLVHLRGGGAFPKAEVETFIDKVLSQAGDLPVQIAHGGGYAGADPATIGSLEAFDEAIARKAPGTKNLVFDISGVVLPEETAKALGSSDEQLKTFVGLMRKIGIERFVIGSDWPAIGRIAPYFALMREKLPVTDAEWAQLCNNLAPYLKATVASPSQTNLPSSH